MIKTLYTPPTFSLFYRTIFILSLIILLLNGQTARANEIRVAVASNFTDTIKTLAKRFEESTNHKVILSFGATGRHYAQIINGAPFDIFFAADSKRPEILEKKGLIVPNSRFTYALGKLILWSPNTKTVDSNANILEENSFRYIAIANPKLAPYGRAAKEALIKLEHWENLRRKTVRGENIGQTFQFVRSSNADLGFVALSQLTRLKQQGSRWIVPDSFYSPIQQQAVLLNIRDTDNKAPQEFLDYVKTKEAQDIIKNFGYGLPKQILTTK